MTKVVPWICSHATDSMWIKGSLLQFSWEHSGLLKIPFLVQQHWEFNWHWAYLGGRCCADFVGIDVSWIPVMCLEWARRREEKAPTSLCGHVGRWNCRYATALLVVGARAGALQRDINIIAVKLVLIYVHTHTHSSLYMKKQILEHSFAFWPF